jgi:hypothetical protein
MTNDQLFQICNTLVLPGWLLMAATPRWKWTGRIVVSGIILILSLVYVTQLIRGLAGDGMDFGSFGSLEGVMALFKDPSAVLMGWVHYLAFDLLAGWFIINDAARQKINQLLVVPCLLFSFMLGPTGWLLYWIIRSVKTRQLYPTPLDD